MVLPRAAFVGVALALLCLVLGAVLWWTTGERATGRDPAPAAPLTPTGVVHEWDEARSAAWADGDAQALTRLYVEGSAVGERDVEMLRRYVERGLRVEGLSTQLLEVAELSRTEEEWVLEVTDRVHAGTVVGPGVRRALPRDRASRRRLTFAKVGDEWRVASVVELAAEGSGGQPG